MSAIDETSLLQERVRRLEDKLSYIEGHRQPISGAGRHNSMVEQGFAQTVVSETPETDHQTQLTNKDTIPKVRRCNFMQFKNRFGPDDGRHAIDVLVSGALLEQEMQEELKFRERRSDNAAMPPSKSVKSKENALKTKNLANTQALEKAQSNDVWVHRVRLQSPALLKILSNVQGESWSSRPCTYLRPFATIVCFQREMKKVLAELEARWASHLDGGATPSTPLTGIGTPAHTDGGDVPEPPVDNCTEALAAMRCYVKFVDDEIMPQYAQFETLKAVDDPKIRFSDLHYLFRTGELVYRPYGSDTSGKGDPREWKRTGKRLWRTYGIRSRDTGYRVRPTDHRKYDMQQDTEGDDSFLIRAFYLEYTGEEFCTMTMEFAIQPFKGLRRIRTLPIYPVRFGPEDLDQYISDAIALGDKTLEYIDLRHVSYDSWTVTRTPKGDPICDTSGIELKHPEYINSDVMIDFTEAFQACPHWKPQRTILRPEPVEQMTEMDDFPILWWSSSSRDELVAESSELVPVRTGVSMWEQNKFISTDPLLACMTENYLKGTLTTREFLVRPEDKGLIACRVFGYVFQDRKFAQMDIQHMAPSSGSRDALDSLRIPKEKKDLIMRSVQGHLLQKANERRHGQARGSQDFIRGKGAGLFILLHGVPGVGKTATAEAIAQTSGKPLFKITCGDLGLTPEQVEASLGGIFRLADSWDCILLMDEVDTFFSQRSKGDAAMTKNALVSVFLRILDYYTGILFMTTNRVGALDEAFRSRIHYSILYRALNPQQTREIWQINLDRLARIDAEHQRKAGRPAMEIPHNEILEFAHHHSAAWNGRQIRNAFQVVRSLAYADAAAEAERIRASGSDEVPPPPRLAVKHFRVIDRVTEDFDAYMKAVFSGQDSGDLAREMEHRADGFTGERWSGDGQEEGGSGLRVGSPSLGSGGQPSRGTYFKPSGNGGRSAYLEPPPQYPTSRRGLSLARGEYSLHSSGPTTNNGPLPGQMPPGSPGTDRQSQVPRLATYDDAEWARPVSPGGDRASFANKVGRTGVDEYVQARYERHERHDSDQGFGDVKNEYGKRDRWS